MYMYMNLYSSTFSKNDKGMDIRLSSFEEMGHVALMIVLIFFDLTL